MAALLAWWPVWIPAAPPSLVTLLALTPQPVPVIPAIAALLALAYLVGVAAVARAGVRWPWWRAALFLLGCALLAAVTGLGIEGYGFALFSVFIAQQMTIMIVVPPLLVLGAPGTLLLRALPRTEPFRPLRGMLVGGLRARWARLLLHPLVALPIFLGTFYGLYFSGLADAMLASWWGHVSLEIVFLAAGVLFAVPLVSPDPLPRRDPHIMKVLDVFAEAAVHAFFGVIVMMAATPLLRTFADPPPGWGLTAMEDQRIAGGIAWGYGEAPTVALLLVMVALWCLDDSRRARQRDRRVTAVGDAELDAYNAYLARLGRR